MIVVECVFFSLFPITLAVYLKKTVPFYIKKDKMLLIIICINHLNLHIFFSFKI